MYKCTECNAIFEECPDYCDCGNDIFEEIPSENSVQTIQNNTLNNIEEPKRERQKARKQLSAKEIEERKEKEADKKKAMTTIYISLLLCFIILVSPPYIEGKANNPAKKIEKHTKIPSVNSFWDDSLPSNVKKNAAEDNLPILNNSFNNIPMPLHNYLVRVGEEFSSNWKQSLVQGTGECKIQFVINKDGVIQTKKILYKSQNETLNDSVLLTLSKMTNLEVPPEEYKGERIILAFSVSETGNKVYYPTK